MSSDKSSNLEGGCEAAAADDGCKPSKSKHCYELRSGCSVKFDQWPVLLPLQLKTRKGITLFDGCRRRRWELADSWCVKICHTKRRKLDGTIVIPKGTVVDGASVPLPWLVSFLSFGILRPNGILLVPSIVHDCAYKCGCLPYDGVRIKVHRHDADWLFRVMISAINRASCWAWIAWLAVRLGWLFGVKYGKKRWGGNWPVVELIFLFALVGLVVAFWGDFLWRVFAGAIVGMNLLTSLFSLRKDGSGKKRPLPSPPKSKQPPNIGES